MEWQSAGLITEETAEGIRAFETKRAEAVSTKWPAMLAMAFGGLMLGAGILLFISANWDELSPAVRFSIVVAAIGLLHILAAWSRAKSEILAMTLHAVGTIAVGGGIAVCGQIFNMSSHWSNAIGLWALGAMGGWWLLREWPQFALAAVLVPAFVSAKLEDLFLPSAQHFYTHGGSFAVIIAIAYISNKASWITHLERRVLIWLGGLAILPGLILMRDCHVV